VVLGARWVARHPHPPPPPATASAVHPEDGRLTPEKCRGLRHNKVFVKVKVC
jgi:hypothetical protein